MSADGIKLRGDITIRMIEIATGRVLQTVEVRNAIMNAGMEAIAKLLTQNTGTPSSWQVAGLMVGTGTTPAAATQTALSGPSNERYYRALSAANKEIVAGPPLVLQFSAQVADIPAGKVITEAGLFLNDGSGTAAAPGTMFARQIHAAVTTAAGVVPDYVWRITLTA
jgi:hypothetical protein